MDTRPDDRVLTIERIFRAAPDVLFDAWTKPEILVRWWGPEGMTTPEYDMDVREGGAWSTVMQNVKGDRHHCSGVYKVLDRPRHLAFTWAWRQEDGSRGHETVVDVTFDPVPEGTKMRLVQKTFADVGQRDAHSHGWNSSFNDLERVVAQL